MSTSSTKKKPLPLKSILKKSVGNSSNINVDDSNRSAIGLGMYQSSDRNSTSLEYRSPERKEEELTRREEEEDETTEEEDSPIEGSSKRQSRLSDFQIPGSESFYGESLLGLGFDSIEPEQVEVKVSF